MTKNKKGGTLLFMTVLILAAVTIVTITIGDIVRSGIMMTRERYYSTLAYYAAEAGGERMLWEILVNGYDIYYECDDLDADPNTNHHNICFSLVDPEDIESCVTGVCQAGFSEQEYYDLPNGSQYEIEYDYEQDVFEATTTLESTGVYSSVGRRVELKF